MTEFVDEKISDISDLLGKANLKLDLLYKLLEKQEWGSGELCDRQKYGLYLGKEELVRIYYQIITPEDEQRYKQKREERNKKFESIGLSHRE